MRRLLAFSLAAPAGLPLAFIASALLLLAHFTDSPEKTQNR